MCADLRLLWSQYCRNRNACSSIGWRWRSSLSIWNQILFWLNRFTVLKAAGIFLKCDFWNNWTRWYWCRQVNAALFREDINFVVWWEMGHTKHDAFSCLGPEQAVHQKDVEEEYQELWLPCIINIFNSVKDVVMGWKKDLVFRQEGISMTGAFFMRSVRWHSGKITWTWKEWHTLNILLMQWIWILLFVWVACK